MTEQGKSVMKYKDALKWITIDLGKADPIVSNWIVRTRESLFASMRDS